MDKRSSNIQDLHDRIAQMDMSGGYQTDREISSILDLIVLELGRIEARLEQVEGTAHRANTVASCLANGIQPD